MYFTVGGKRFELSRAEVERRMEGVEPNPVREHYVEVGGRRFPPKQVLAAVTGLDLLDFQTTSARRVLGKLGFELGRA